MEGVDSMTKQALGITELLDDSGHLTERAVEAIVRFCSDQEELPEGSVLLIQEHIGRFAGSRDFRLCDRDCQEKILDRLGTSGEKKALEKGIFTAVVTS